MRSMEDIDDPPIQEKQTRVGLAMGLWLTGVFAAALFGRMEGNKAHVYYEVITLASLVWPAGYFLLSPCRFVPHGFSPGMIAGLALFGIFCGLSSFFSPAPLESVQYVALTILTVLVVLQFNTNLNAAQYEIGVKFYAVLGSILVSGFSLYDYVPGVRLGGGKGILNPASFALITMSVFVTAMMIRRAIIRLAILVGMGTVIYLTGTRASAVAALIGLAVTLFLRRRTAGTEGHVVLVFCVLVGGVVAAYYGDAVTRGASDFFAIQDRHRGLESGGSGRLETWKATWNLFLSHPILGVGFRTHEALLKINSSAHNGYLALLAEIGVIGFTAILCVTLSGLWNIRRRIQDPSQAFSYSVLLGLACGYLVLAIFERYFINAGNPTSLLFLLSILSPAPSEEIETDYGEEETGEFVSESADADLYDARVGT